MNSTRRPLTRAATYVLMALGLVLSSQTIIGSPASADTPDVQPEQRDRAGLKYDAYFLPSLDEFDGYYIWHVNGRAEYDTINEHSTNRASQVVVDLVIWETSEVVDSWTLVYTDGPEVEDVRNTYRLETGDCTGDGVDQRVMASVFVTNNNAKPIPFLSVEPVLIETGRPTSSVGAEDVVQGVEREMPLESGIGYPGLEAGHWRFIVRDRSGVIDRFVRTVSDKAGECPMAVGVVRGKLTRVDQGRVRLRLNAKRSYDPVNYSLIVTGQRGKRHVIKGVARGMKVTNRALRVPIDRKVVLKANGRRLATVRS